MKSRLERAEGYTDGEAGLEAPTWGRIKKLARLVPQILQDFPALGSDDVELDLGEAVEKFPDLGDVVLALYCMPFEKFRALTAENYLAECERFAEPLPMERAQAALLAVLRDWDALQASLVELADTGKVPGLVVERSHSREPNSRLRASA